MRFSIMQKKTNNRSKNNNNNEPKVTIGQDVVGSDSSSCRALFFDSWCHFCVSGILLQSREVNCNHLVDVQHREIVSHSHRHRVITILICKVGRCLNLYWARKIRVWNFSSHIVSITTRRARPWSRG